MPVWISRKASPLRDRSLRENTFKIGGSECERSGDQRAIAEALRNFPAVCANPGHAAAAEGFVTAGGQVQGSGSTRKSRRASKGSRGSMLWDAA